MATATKTSYKTKDLIKWEWSDVNQWLTDSNLVSVISKLEKQNISGLDLFHLSEEHMKEFGIQSFHEINLLNEKKHLKMLEQ